MNCSWEAEDNAKGVCLATGIRYCVPDLKVLAVVAAFQDIFEFLSLAEQGESGCWFAAYTDFIYN